jgi:hypothetical protein
VSRAARLRELVRWQHVKLRLIELFAAPTDGSGAAVFRIGFAVLAISNTIWVATNLDRWFSEGGVTLARSGGLHWSLYRFAPAATWMGPLHVALLGLGSLLMLIGLRPRWGAFLLFFAHTSLQHRTPSILNSGDRLFAIVAFLAIFMPLGHRFAVDAWLRRRRGVPAPPASIWAVRLLQIQIAYVYANTSMSKLMNQRWIEGRALRDVLASPVFAEWPTWIDFWPLIHAMTWGTLAFELGFPLLVWFRRTRMLFLLGGIVFHLMIDALMVIPMFSWIMIVSYGAFLEDDQVRRFFARFSARGGADPLLGGALPGGAPGEAIGVLPVVGPAAVAGGAARGLAEVEAEVEVGVVAAGRQLEAGDVPLLVLEEGDVDRVAAPLELEELDGGAVSRPVLVDAEAAPEEDEEVNVVPRLLGEPVEPDAADQRATGRIGPDVVPLDRAQPGEAGADQRAEHDQDREGGRGGE